MLYYDNNLENMHLSVKWRHLVVWYANKCERLNVNNHCGLPTKTCILYIYIYYIMVSRTLYYFSTCILNTMVTIIITTILLL